MKQQSDVQPDLMMHGYVHGEPVLQLQICFVLNRMNLIGSDLLKYVKMKHQISVKHDYVVSNHEF